MTDEQIIEMARKAGLHGLVEGGIINEFKAFAELIVKECLDQCYNRGMNDELYAGQLKAAAYIEEHFGVEE